MSDEKGQFLAPYRIYLLCHALFGFNAKHSAKNINEVDAIEREREGIANF